MEPTEQDVVDAAGELPLGIGPLALEVARRAGAPAFDDVRPVGQRLAGVGLSLSAVQAIVDGLVRQGRLREVRGKDLWDLGLPTAGTKAMGRYYLTAGSSPDPAG